MLSCKNDHTEVHTNKIERQSTLLWISFFNNQNSTVEHSFNSRFNICKSDNGKLIWAWREEQLIDEAGVFTSALKCGIWSEKKAKAY